MKKVIKLAILIIPFLLSLNETLSYFNTNTSFINVFTTKSYVLKLNANGGYFNSEDISIKNNSTVLPTPTKSGYTFLGFSDSISSDINYSTNIDNIDLINNKNLYAKWKTITYTISYNLNGGTISGQKTNYTIEDTFTLPIPTREGYLFSGWTGTDLSTPTQTVTISKSIGNRNYIANWNTNSYYVDVNPILDGVQNNAGYSGYTFDVYVNGTLVADDVSDWANNINYGSTVRVVTNEKTGHSSGFDQTITVETGTNEIKPSWSRNTYQGHFYYINTSGVSTFWTATNNKYGDYISTPSVDNVGKFGYNDNFYKFVDFSAWTTWYQPDYAVGFTVNIAERTCRATFGTLSNSNANYQQTKFHDAGYSYCNVNPTNTKEVVCNGTYSQVLSAYNSAWNILPSSGNGFSRYKDMSCDSGWSTYATR